MFASVLTGTLVGIDALPVTVEVDEAPGLPALELVGLPAVSVRESKVRVKAALAACDFALPPRRYLVNLAPGDLRKTGSSFDLGIAAALLAVTVSEVASAARAALSQTLVLGELSIEGSVLPVRGALAQLRSATARGISSAIIPFANQEEAALAPGIEVRLVRHLSELADHLTGAQQLPLVGQDGGTAAPSTAPLCALDFADVKGQGAAKRALEIAAVGSHHALLVGPPGTGKSMLAERMLGIMPDLTPAERLDVATIAGTTALRAVLDTVARPFRAPHHSASVAAMVGGGDPVRPGELTMAHHGVLFLDEMPEFRRDAVEALRTTLESGQVTIARASYRTTLPAQALVVGAMNPCPCGFFSDPTKVCRCSPEQVARYLGRVSGPLMDRFDLHVQVPRVPGATMRDTSQAEKSSVVRQRVLSARAFREKRRLDGTARTSGQSLDFLSRAIDSLGMSARAYRKVLRVARTVADLSQELEVRRHHVSEALMYRRFDRESAKGRPAVAS